MYYIYLTKHINNGFMESHSKKFLYHTSSRIDADNIVSHVKSYLYKHHLLTDSPLEDNPDTPDYDCGIVSVPKGTVSVKNKQRAINTLERMASAK